MLGAHVESIADQNVSRALLSKRSQCAVKFLWGFYLEIQKTTKWNWFDNFCLASHFAQCVHSSDHFAQYFDHYLARSDMRRSIQ